MEVYGQIANKYRCVVFGSSFDLSGTISFFEEFEIESKPFFLQSFFLVKTQNC